MKCWICRDSGIQKDAEGFPIPCRNGCPLPKAKAAGILKELQEAMEDLQKGPEAEEIRKKLQNCLLEKP